MRISIIGYKNHALRLKSILNKLGHHNILTYNHHKDTTNTLRYSDVYFISSPNETHIDWILRLQEYNKYIYCEKPPATNLKDLCILKNMVNEKLYFNFNYRHSSFAKLVIKHMLDEELGKLLYIHFISTHGLAFKKSFQNNWRFNGKNLFSSIIGNLGIHYVDLVEYISGGINEIESKSTSIISNKLPDTVNIKLNTKICNAEIFISYAAPFRNQATAIFDNGIVELLDGQISIQTPRDTYDRTGRFAPPKKKYLYKGFNNAKDYYDNSLNQSIMYFLNLAKTNAPVPKDEQIISLQSCEKLLNSITN